MMTKDDHFSGDANYPAHITVDMILKGYETCRQACILLRRCYTCQDYCGTPTLAKCTKCVVQHDMVRVYKLLNPSTT